MIQIKSQNNLNYIAQTERDKSFSEDPVITPQENHDGMTTKKKYDMYFLVYFSKH